MRYRRLRFDIWLCLALSVLISFLPAKIVKSVLPKKYASYVQAHTVADGNIGGKADQSVYRAQSVDDLLSHDTFTVISPGIEYCNRGAGYYQGKYMYALTLPSGERVAACINMDSVQNSDESIYSGEATLPMGRIVYKDLTGEKNFLEQIEHAAPLSRTDFYVDMLGDGGKVSEDDFSEAPIMITQILTVAIFFPLFHTLGSKWGIFPYFFKRKA